MPLPGTMQTYFELTLLRLLPFLPDTNELNLHSAYATTGLIKFKFCDFMKPFFQSTLLTFLLLIFRFFGLLNTADRIIFLGSTQFMDVS